MPTLASEAIRKPERGPGGKPSERRASSESAGSSDSCRNHVSGADQLSGQLFFHALFQGRAERGPVGIVRVGALPGGLRFWVDFGRSGIQGLGEKLAGLLEGV